MARLILATAEGHQAIELAALNRLGRHPSNSIQLLDKIVSKEHCILELRDGHFILRDLGSLNGTFINAERVNGERMLRHGDEILLGSTRARYDDGSSPLDLATIPLSPGAVQRAAPGLDGFAGVDGFGRPAAPVPLPSRPQAPGMPGAPPHGAHGTAAMNAHPNPSQGPTWQPPPPSAHPQQAGMHNASAFPRPQPPQGGNPLDPYAARAPAPPSARGPAPPQGQGFGGANPFGSRPADPPGVGPVQPGVRGVPVLPGGRGVPVLPGQRAPTFAGTRVDMTAADRAIGTQIAALAKDFLPFDQVASDGQQLRIDYERLRITWELSRDIGLEHDLDKLLEKILLALFKFVKADRGVILLKGDDGELEARTARRRDGSETPIEVSKTILNHVTTEKKSVITHDAAMDFAASKGKSMILNRISSAIVVPLLHETDVLGAVWLDSESLAQFQQKDLEIITAVSNQAAMFIANTLLARKIEQEIITRDRFSRLLSPNVAEQVISGKLEIKKGGTLVQECTVFNSDIRGFTRMSEGTTAEVMVDMLNEYFEEMVATIFKHEGTLDKFMGDGIMAFWGVPAFHPDDAVRCVQSALEQMEVLGQFNRRRMDRNEPPLAIGMGIHTGPLVAGYVGSSKALSYTVIGDTANTSARLCGIALAGQIIVSESTLGKMGNRFELEELPAAALKGKEKPLRIFNVKRERPSAASASSKTA